MSLTKQQQQAIDAVKTNPLVKIKAVAGAGKTFTLTQVAKELNVSKGLYLAYNKSIADEATQKFKGTNIECSTIHSLAYKYTVRPYGLKVGFFNARDVQCKLPSYAKADVVRSIEEFCLSAETDVLAYQETLDPIIQDSFLKHLNMMTTGEITCTHSFYLKLFHLYVLSGDIIVPEYDLLLVDEAGDITELTLEIFKLIKATKKIAVGDPMQNIYSFNHTINAFTALTEGVEVELTESFRVSTQIAKRIETFVRNTTEPTFEFKGREYSTSELHDNTKAYIARNNSGLLQEMFRLQSEGKCFHTTRPVKQILELPLILANLTNGKAITDSRYKHIEKARKDYYKSIQQSTMSILKYVEHACERDDEIVRAARVVRAHGPHDLNTLTKYATACASKPCNLTLTTAHSSKGLEFNTVEIAPDLNEKITKVLLELKLGKCNDKAKAILQEELRLYYVATSRAMTSLLNATHM